MTMPPPRLADRSVDAIGYPDNDQTSASSSESSSSSPIFQVFSTTGLAIINALSCRRRSDFTSYEQVGRTIRRNITVIDYSYVTFLRVINKVYSLCKAEDLFEPERLLTYREKIHFRQIKLMQKNLGTDSVYTKFSKEAADLVHTILPIIAGKKMTALPAAAEGWALYRSGLIISFFNYELDRAMGYRDTFINSEMGHAASRAYCMARTRFSQSFLDTTNITPFVNFHHLFLSLSTKIKAPSGDSVNGSKPSGSESTPQPLGIIIMQSLSESLALIEKCDAELSKKKFECPKDEFIYRLEWYKKNNVLPKGLPNPREVSLTDSNLNEKLQIAMNAYLDEVAELILTKIDTKKKSILTQFLHWLIERRLINKKVLALLIGELLINQVSDPVRFSQIILLARGIETADYELHGFGRGKKEQILAIGQAMLNKSFDPETSTAELKSLFINSGLKANRQSGEGIDQRRELKEKLHQLVYDLLCENIKGEKGEFSHSSPFKWLKNSVSDIPILNFATSAMHVLLTTTTSMVGYLTRSPEYNDMPFVQWMIQNIAGAAFHRQLTEGIMELIHHPSWRFIVFHLIESLTDNMQCKLAAVTEEESINQIRTIFHFAFFRLTKHMTVQPTEGLFDLIANPDNLAMIRQCLQPSEGKPFFDKLLESILPTVKETKLYQPIPVHFRNWGFDVEGDDIFWEEYIRYHLNDLLVEYKKKWKMNDMSISETAAFRDKFVDQLLALNEEELRKCLSCKPQNSLLLQMQPVQVTIHTIVKKEDIGGASSESMAVEEEAAIPSQEMIKESVEGSLSSKLMPLPVEGLISANGLLASIREDYVPKSESSAGSSKSAMIQEKGTLRNGGILSSLLEEYLPKTNEEVVESSPFSRSISKSDFSELLKKELSQQIIKKELLEELEEEEKKSQEKISSLSDDDTWCKVKEENY